MKIIRRSAALRWILTSALAARSASAKDPTAHFSMAAPGMRLKWYRLKTGKGCTVSLYQTLHLLPLLPDSLTRFTLAALNGFRRQGRLCFCAFSKRWPLRGPVSINLNCLQIVTGSHER